MKFSIILYLDKLETLEKAMEPLNKYRDCEVIIADPYCSEESASITKKFLSDRVYVKECEGAKDYEAYGICLAQAKGEYINFNLSSSYFGTDTLARMQENAGKRDENGNRPTLMCTHILGIRDINDITREIEYKMQSTAPGWANIRVQTKKINMVLQSYFIKRELAAAVSFKNELKTSAVHEYLLNLLLKEQNIYNDTKCDYTYTVLLESSHAFYETAREEDWYIPALDNFIIPTIKKLAKENGTAPTFSQVYLLYLIHAKYCCNYFERDRGVLDREHAFIFDDKVNEFLTYINDNVIFQFVPCAYNINRYLKKHFYLGKCRKLGEEPLSTEVIKTGRFKNRLVLKNKAYLDMRAEDWEDIETNKDAFNLCIIGKIQNQKVTVKVLDKIGDNIELDIVFDSAFLDTTDYKLSAVLSDGKKETEIELVPTEAYSLIKFFTITIDRKKTYHLSVPIKDFYGKELFFTVNMDNEAYRVKLLFPNEYSRICHSTKSYYMIDDKKYITYKDESVYMSSFRPFGRFFAEIKFFAARLIKEPIPLSERIEYLFIRLMYWLCYPVYSKRRIWISFDKLYKGGDNGEYMFRYCMDRGGVDMYYIINKDAPDYKRLVSQYGRHILKQDSLRVKLLALFCEAVLATHVNILAYMGYTKKSNVFIKDLFKAVIVCIQHGLTIQKIAQFQNRIYDDTRLYTLASKYEKENVSAPIYDYRGKELKLTGLARYDGLKNDDRKQILITPTWRKNVVNQSIAFVKKTHNDAFKNSEYYRIYNSLINDKDLIDCAKQTGYKIIYLLHPAMSSQAEDFDKNDYVEIVQATGDMSYEKILTQSSLMVTDYSGVQFDFAYQRKPLVYYHPDTLPPHYAEGGLKYDTMGFGPICKNHTEIVSTLCEYMKNGCKMTDDYIARADDFFCYDDFNNCERIYNEVMNFMSDKSNF